MKQKKEKEVTRIDKNEKKLQKICLKVYILLTVKIYDKAIIKSCP